MLAVGGGINDSYEKFTSINVSSAAGSPTLTEYPGYLRVTNGSESNTGADGNITINWDDKVDGPEDLDLSNTTNHRVDWHYESFDAQAQEAEIWFRANVTRDGTEQLRLHHGSGSTTSNTSESTVWDGVQGILARYSLQESTSGTGNADVYEDSTSNNLHADDEVSATGQNGLYDDGQELDGTDDQITGFNMDTQFASSDNFSFIGWINVDAFGDRQIIHAGGDGGSGDNPSYQLEVTNDDAGNNGELLWNNHGTAAGTTDTRVSTNTWEMITSTVDVSSGDVNVAINNGTFENIHSDQNSINDNDLLTFGRRNDDKFQFGGNVDEFQIYKNHVLAGDWKNATYEMSPAAGQTLFVQQAAEPVDRNDLTNDSDAWVNESGDTMTGDLNMTGHSILDIGSMLLDDLLNMTGNRITDVGTPQNPSDAATKGYVDEKEEWVSVSGDNVTGSINMTGNSLTKVGKITGADVDRETQKVFMEDVLDMRGNGIYRVAHITTDDAGGMGMDKIDLGYDDILNVGKIQVNSIENTPLSGDDDIKVKGTLTMSSNVINHTHMLNLNEIQRPSCDASTDGNIIYNNSAHWGCNGTHWNALN